jgi:DNA-binding transcriptional LysR family regulator
VKVNWDDLRFVLAVATEGSLLAAGRRLGVDHTTVGRRVDAAEQALALRLFTRTNTGYVPTADAERLLGAMGRVEAAVLDVEREAAAQQGGLNGRVRITSPETFGMSYLAGRLGAFGQEHPGLSIELLPAGQVFDLARREAELAVRTFRSATEGLVAKKVATVAYGFYATREYLSRRPLRGPEELGTHAIFSTPPSSDEIEHRWLDALAPGLEPAFSSEMSTALQHAARTSAGVAILPRYLGEADPLLRHVPMPQPPTEALWLTVHRDLRRTPRVRAVIDFLSAVMKDDAVLFRGRQARAG